MKTGTVVLISRHWNNPNIQIKVTDKGIGIAMDLDDFIDCLIQESGNPAGLMTNNQLGNKIKLAKDKIVRLMKKETLRVQ